MLRSFEAVLWDMNGVLLDDESYQWEAFKQVLEARGFPIPEEDFNRYCGVTEQECFALAMNIAHDHDDVLACMEERRTCYQTIMNGRLPLYPGAAEAVGRAEAAGYRQAIASGACRVEVLAVAEALGADRFGAMVAAEDVTRGKPNPEGYLKAASLLNVSPSQCLVIEDSVHGIEAALAAGTQCVAVAHSFPIERLSRAHLAFPTLEAALQSGELGF